MLFGRLALLAASALGALATPLLKTYTNPVKAGVGADPWVLKHGGAYYLATATGNNAVFVTRSDNLAQWPENGPMVYNATGLFGAVWAPELHFLRGRFYIYVAMTTPDGDNTFHRMYVLRGTSATDPGQPFAVGERRGAQEGTQAQIRGSRRLSLHSPLDAAHGRRRVLAPSTAPRARPALHGSGPVSRRIASARSAAHTGSPSDSAARSRYQLHPATGPSWTRRRAESVLHSVQARANVFALTKSNR